MSALLRSLGHSPITTAIGILCLVLAAGVILRSPDPLAALEAPGVQALLVGGLGLLVAKDGNATGTGGLRG